MRILSALLWGYSLALTGSDKFDAANYVKDDVIIRDIVIVGGGSTGTFAALSLLDLGQRIVMVEQEPRLGGHTIVYTEPKTGTKIDYGVQSYLNSSVVRDFFGRFKIPLTRFSLNANATVYADFETGEVFTDFEPGFNLEAYSAQVEKYPYLLTSWDLPDPVPEDLLLPFGEFITKYSLQDVAYTIWTRSRGSGNILSQPTVYILKSFGAPCIRGLREGTLVTAHHDNSEIYDKALEELGPDALVSSTVIESQRSIDGVRLIVQTPHGIKLIIASKALVSIPPTLENMRPFSLDDHEESRFGRFNSSASYVALVTETGLPSGYQFFNTGDSNRTFRIPTLPALYNLNPTVVDGIFSTWYGGLKATSEADVKAEISASINRLRKALRRSNNTQDDNHEIRFLAYKSHTPMHFTVPTEDIGAGFYRELQALQGHRNTWYTGAAFLSQHAGPLWNFTQDLMSAVLA
ncbi:hypothetical protein EYZ11_001011 [Aspergillus tanneri]|uniref:Amine oxidase domain-containing protein n=1 Tax=Aspergillus tanneri TaxID=1220188 RepID=A0A4S3JVT9_9EURO|nr:uncharacterized protein ATNIH1004_002622 [Aspergillus tanneri]KAA8649943.1 hypothetical protein ATNIH1004_002622 [Aspergillus tanneri]THC99551.1 hypothetical protein EYZ11_001011 [Aspergillus tanneri]